MSGERRSVTEWKNRYPGGDIWVLGGGDSLNFVDPAFFEEKITLGVNEVYRRIRCTCLVRRSQWRAEEAWMSGIPLIQSESMAMRQRLQDVYGCRVYSLNPFLNFGLEGHCYRREP